MYITLGIVFFFIFLYILYLFDVFSNEAEAKKNIVYPPWTNTCPDYWVHKKEEDDNGNSHGICQRDTKNPTGLETCENYYPNNKFNPANFTKNELEIMSSECSLPWEGIHDP